VRLRGVHKNDAKDDRDDTCELVVRTDTQSITMTLDEGGQAQFAEDWQLQAIDVRPAPGANIEGAARIRITPPSAGT